MTKLQCRKNRAKPPSPFPSPPEGGEGNKERGAGTSGAQGEKHFPPEDVSPAGELEDEAAEQSDAGLGLLLP